MSAPEENQFWRVRSSHGRHPVFSDPEQLWEAATQYFEWVDANPLMASELVKFQGAATLAKVPKMRAMTVGGLCIFLDITRQTWAEYKENKGQDFSTVVNAIEEIIRTQKFEGAAADLLNSNIIARDLGLADKQEHSGLTIKIESGDADL